MRRRSVRLRLTLLFGGLFLGAARPCWRSPTGWSATRQTTSYCLS